MATSVKDYLDQSHLEALNKNYDEVGNQTWEFDDLQPEFIQSSISLFTEESLKAGTPVPKDLEVYALLSGISFSDAFVAQLEGFQNDIKKILGDKLYYFVEPQNLGLEHCVFKWPDESWDPARRPVIQRTLSSIEIPAFNYQVFGLQLNRDGCIVAKGYDEHQTIYKLRETLKDRLEFFPQRQSGWAHVPFGRILEPLGHEVFNALREYFASHRFVHLATEHVNTLRFVHETQWYMVKRSLIEEYHLEG